MEIAAPPGYRCRFEAEIDSTSDALKREAADGAPDGTVIAAGRQTAGRGRYGRAWISPPGNLYISVLMRDIGPAAEAAQLSFVAAVAMGEAIAAMTPDTLAVRFKWPNDLLADGRKFAGILLESGGDSAAPWIVVGAGVNLVSHPAETSYPATDLKVERAYVDAPDLAAGYLAALADWRTRWRRQGFAPVRAAWLSAAAGRGEAIRLRLADRPERVGRFVDLDADGALVFREDGRTEVERITAGEVHLLAGTGER